MVDNFDKSEISRYMHDKWEFIQSKNRWIVPKVSEALNENSGDAIVFLEHDDLFERNKLKIIYDVFKQKSKIYIQ
nr:glycosyltransferase family 2 protein [Sulfolobus islandicus]